MATLPNINYVPNATTGLTSIQLTKPNSADFPVVASQFPSVTDTFKTLSYQAPSETIIKQQLSRYHTLAAKTTGGTATSADLTELTALISNIRNYVLTEDDYNLMVTAISNIEVYIKNYLQTDLNNKAARLDQELKLAIDTINAFMTSLENAYSSYPSGWPPVADGTIVMKKLSQEVQSAITSGGTTLGTIVSSTKPSLPVAGKAVAWIDTNISDAD